MSIHIQKDTIPNRSAGILMHISSLPGKSGCGTLGKSAYDFIDILKRAGQHYWQILPINPVVKFFEYSPYASTSTFAGNPYFVDYELALEMHPQCRSAGSLPDVFNSTSDLKKIDTHLMPLFRKVYNIFLNSSSHDLDEYNAFCEENRYWLDDYCLYRILCSHFQTGSWLDWDSDIAFREEEAVQKYSKQYTEEIEFNRFLQYLFFEQFACLKEYAHKNDVNIIGDIPIYISYDSSDAWAHSGLFLTDDEFRPDPVAGVPPDYFSKTGQLWGNPLYKWFSDTSGRELNESVVAWWESRLSHLMIFYDLIRIDHFRAFSSYWGISNREKTAVNGNWYNGPGKPFFDELKKRLDSLPLIAEDLGIITDEVRELRDSLHLPGMKVLQFAFDKSYENEFLPHNITNCDCVLYTGTHDNNTTNGWFYEGELNNELKSYVKEYMNLTHDHEFHKYFIKLAYSTTAKLVIIPVQDFLGFGSKFRFNTPGTLSSKNWSWRLESFNMLEKETGFMRHLAAMYNRGIKNGKESKQSVKKSDTDPEKVY